MDIQPLKAIGLTDGEVKVYLALMKLGSSKTGPLASLAGVSSSKVYKILDRLEKKGLAGHVLRGHIQHFRVMEPRRLLDYVEERQAEITTQRQLIEQMLPALEKQQLLEKPNAALLQGFRSVTNFFRNLVDELKPQETYYVIGGGYGEGGEKLRRFFYKHHQRRAGKRIRLKMLANYDVKERLEKTTQQNAEIRYLPHYLITNMEIIFYGNKALLALWTEEPFGFLIESPEAVKSFQAYFDAWWKIAKP